LAVRDKSSGAKSELVTREFLSAMTRSLDISPRFASKVEFAGDGDLASIFAVSDFAAAAVGAAAAAAGEFIDATLGVEATVRASRPLASLWFGSSLRPVGWTLPPVWDAVAGNYKGKDGWIRLHTNAPHHRAAALAVLGVDADKAAVSRAVADWDIEVLESAVVEKNGCAAAMRSIAEWARHPQGQSVRREPLIAMRATPDRSSSELSPTPQRPLAGARILDLTRVLAGPVATRFLAGLGADVLRVDPPDWDEPAIVPDVTLGKRCARLDLREPRGRSAFEDLLRDADVLVHGYRSDALDKLGLDARRRRALRPGLIDVALNAYGWSGPWRTRRGFDSLVQMSAGIADEGMKTLGMDQPTPLPVQANDHATGYLMAAAVLRALTERARTGRGFEARASLARTAQLLVSGPRRDGSGNLGAPSEEYWSQSVEATAFGPAHRLMSPVTINNRPLHWDRPAARLGSSPPTW
jgi:hypothetical protein